MVTDPPLPISALEHHEYCPRQCALIHADGVWYDNRHTVKGSRGHRRVDHEPGRRERGRTVLRGIPLWSERLHLTGRADAVEVADDGTVTPVEYKIGSAHGRAAEVQLCAEALCLEEMLKVEIASGAIWYSSPRRKTSVAIGSTLREYTLTAIDRVRTTIRGGVLPVAVNDRRCAECQLIDYCLPGLTDADGGQRVTAYLESEVWQCAS